MFDWTSERHKAPDIRVQAASRFLFITNHLLRKHTKGGIFQRLIKIDTLVTRLCDLETSEPRDTVFALISLSHDGSASNSLVPNYTKTSCEVFVDFVWYVISSSQSMDIILRPWAPRTVSVPSWILRTGASDQSRLMFQDKTLNGIHNHEIHSNPLYAASGRSSPSCRIYRHASSYALETKGFIITSVRQTRGDAVHGDVPISWGALAYREKLWSFLIGGKTLEGLPPPETWRAICETVFAEGKHYWKQGTHDIPVHLTELIDAINGSAHDESRLSKAFLASFPQTENLLPFLEGLRTCTWNRRLVEISTGNWGLAPLSTRRRDIVCILMGCSLPVVLRPKGDLFTIVGAAYMHGMSDGEAMEGLREGKFALRDFVLV
ncbi:hypothetical protein BU25DRAFT_413549 [Macroventuria anomochaeta]|uniref:Uncharacterized protein n=1 Tax=Macroventuria anomochaeta TaxID=301207 RepID=A0ACB6RR50_9PLEO|nr:uncharacterized protein BU25DRAFT_413549 [Macroventuria anomochaeta]KAF2624288.1 hypothetical protein BU25DRAFT_413549 [Macroventuria anomochaeta]